MNCIQEVNLSSCIAVKQQVTENPSFDNLDKIQAMFAEFAEKALDLQTKMRDRIDSMGELFVDVPNLCNKKRMVDGVVSMTKTVDIMLPNVLERIRRSYGDVKRHRFNTRGFCDRFCVEIPDYSQKIIDLNWKIMGDMKQNAVDSIEKMSFVVEDLLGKQVSFFIIYVTR